MNQADRGKVWLAAARPRTLPAALAPVLVGSALAWHEAAFRPLAAFVCLVFALLIQIGTNFANDYYDFVKGADSASRRGPTRAVAAGLIAPAVMKRAMIAVFVFAFAVGLSLVYLRGWGLVIIGLASIGCGFAYTGGPYPLGYHGLGDLFVFLFFGLVAVATTFYVQAGGVSADAFLAGIPIGLLAANILVVNNYRDRDTDAKAGKRTLVVRWGPRAAVWQYALAHLLAMLVPVLLVVRGFTAWTVLPLVLIPLAWVQTRALARSREAGEQIALLAATARYLAIYALLFSAGLMQR